MTDSTDSDEFYYQLKKIGPAPSCPRVPNVMRLNLGLTKIGRGQSNDYFLDSSLLKNFISRSHAEIFGTRLETGDVEFVLTDKGLNGTFINDIRTQKTVVLQEADKITFGHTNGYKIQPGSTATQPNSEFQFIYERVPKTPRTSEISDVGLSQENFNREETKDIHHDHKVDSAGDRSPDYHQNITPKSPHKKSKLLEDAHMSSSNDISAQLDTSHSKSKKHSSKKVRKSRKRNSDSTGSSSALEGSVSRLRDSRGGRGVCSETLPAMDDSDEEQEEEESDSQEKQKTTRHRSKTKKKTKKKAPPVKEEVMSFSEESSDNASVNEQVRSVLMAITGFPAFKTAPHLHCSAEGLATFDDAEVEEEEDDDEDEKPEADQKRSRKSSSTTPVVPSKPKQKPARKFPKKRALKEEEPSPSTTKGSSKSGSGKKPVKKRKVTATTTSQTTEAAEEEEEEEPKPEAGLEAGVEWYEGDKCASESCKMPKKKRTQWIQCDDCDNWFHNVCVGLTNKQVDSMDDYSCGCCG